MPISREGLAFSRYQFKAIENVLSGGCHGDVYYPIQEAETASQPIGAVTGLAPPDLS
jgi:hypothetical protein